LADFIADCAFVYERFQQSGLDLITILSVSFMVLPILVNVFLVLKIIRYEFASNEVCDRTAKTRQSLRPPSLVHHFLVC